VLFSNDNVAAFINRNFEPAWQSVRPVPLVHIDFGNGRMLTRTLHGNIATYACTADGKVLDILPGIYAPDIYQDRLNQFRLLANFVDQLGKDQRPARLLAYHRGQAEALAKHQPPARFINIADMSKRAIEGGLKAVLMAGSSESIATPAPLPATAALEPRLADAEDLAGWKELTRDSAINETARRLQVHRMLATDLPVSPEAVTRRLYRDILHADLDDPYLGLGSVLFANYPFKDKVP
jgi:hypothetical protein